jgi:hypothetical protein
MKRSVAWATVSVGYSQRSLYKIQNTQVLYAISVSEFSELRILITQ